MDDPERRERKKAKGDSKTQHSLATNTASVHISFRKIKNSEKNPVLGPGGSEGAILTVNFEKRVARKLRRIILLHLRLITFGFHFGKTRKPFICMIFGLFGYVRDSQNQFLALETPNDSK